MRKRHIGGSGGVWLAVLVMLENSRCPPAVEGAVDGFGAIGARRHNRWLHVLLLPAFELGLSDAGKRKCPSLVKWADRKAVRGWAKPLRAKYEEQDTDDGEYTDRDESSPQLRERV